LVIYERFGIEQKREKKNRKVILDDALPV